jgi:pimeloyl-ACP methyl ester carboxylesterase
MWQPFAAALPGRRILMFDLPGITGGSAQSLPIDMPGLAVWLTQLMDALNIDDVDVLGYSWGGVLAQQLARDRPHRVRAMVLASTNFGFGGIPTLEMPPLVNLIPNGSGDNPWKLFSAAMGGAANAQNPIGALVNALNPYTTPLEGYLRQFYALTCWTSLPWLDEIHVPTMVLAGNDDPYVPVSTTRRLAEAIPDARLELIPGGGHLLPVNNPTRMAGLVEEFLCELDADEGRRSARAAK